MFTNVFGAGFPAKHIPSFTWGGIENNATYQLDKALALGEKVFNRRNLAFDDREIAILTNIFQQSAKYRSWEEKVVVKEVLN